MLVLPSGKIVDITANRAKYHALRHIGIAPDAEHRALYPLIDIVYRHVNDQGIIKRGWTEYDFQYSPYTLDTVRSAFDWTAEDKDAFYLWIRNPQRIRIIELARRHLVDKQPQLSVKTHSAPRHLYSLLKKRISELPLQRAAAKQWLATITNMKRHAIREEEMHWSGIINYLRQTKPNETIHKNEILKQLCFDNLRLELTTEQIWSADGGLSFKEIARRMPHQAVYRAALKLDESCHCILRFVDNRYNYRVGVVKTLRNGHSMALNKFWFALDPYGRAIPNAEALDSQSRRYFNCSESAKTAANRHARQHLGMRSGTSPHTHFDHLTLFGGQSYREWLLCLPDYQRTFFGAHYFDHNILAHIRTTIRQDDQKRQLLFIEEIQSDWHQSGKLHGYDNSVWGKIANAPFKKEWPLLATKLILIYASQNGFAGIAWANGTIQELRYQRNLSAIKNYYDKDIPQSLNRLGKAFQLSVQSCEIETREPWLKLEKSQNMWRVADGKGRFKTRAKYHSRDEAMAVIARHCKTIQLKVPVFYFNDMLRKQIASKGLPLFGESID